MKNRGNFKTQNHKESLGSMLKCLIFRFHEDWWNSQPLGRIQLSYMLQGGVRHLRMAFTFCVGLKLASRKCRREGWGWSHTSRPGADQSHTHFTASLLHRTPISAARCMCNELTLYPQWAVHHHTSLFAILDLLLLQAGGRYLSWDSQ